jgi:hypothetical protein
LFFSFRAPFCFVADEPVLRMMASRAADCTEDGDVSLKQSYARSFLDALSLRVSRLAHDFSLRIVTAMLKGKTFESEQHSVDRREREWREELFDRKATWVQINRCHHGRYTKSYS